MGFKIQRKTILANLKYGLDFLIIMSVFVVFWNTATWQVWLGGTFFIFGIKLILDLVNIENWITNTLFKIIGTSATLFVALYPATLFRFQPVFSLLIVSGLVIWLNLHLVEGILQKFGIITFGLIKTEHETKFSQWLATKKQNEIGIVNLKLNENRVGKKDMVLDHDKENKPKKLSWIFLHWFFKSGVWLFVILFIVLSFLFSSIQKLGGEIQTSASATANVTSVIPAQTMVGQNFSFTTSFNNSGTTVGYSPFIDLVFPVTGNDGAGASIDDGIDFTSATYLGVPLTATQLTFPASGTGCTAGQTPVNHPLAVTNAGIPVLVCGNPGDKLVVLSLPFGSFVPTQPAAPVVVTASLSNLADVGTPLTIQSRAGFRFGNTPLNDYTTDPSILSSFSSSSTTPTVFTIAKTYNGPENETATGPNFPRQYTITADIAAGQTISNLQLQDFLPNNLAFLSVVSSSPAGAVINKTPTVGSPANVPNNELSVTFPSVTGTAGATDASVTLLVYATDNNANSSSVISHTTGDDAIAINDAKGNGTWTPIDARDLPGSVSSDITLNDHTLNLRSIAVQKGVTVVGGGAVRAGAVLEYTLNFQISDYFAFENIALNDIISDGQLFDTTYSPTFTATEKNSTSTGPFASGSFNVNKDLVTTGQTTIGFDLNSELASRGLDIKLLGGCVPNTGAVVNCSTFNQGATTGQIKFRTIVQDNFTILYPSGDKSVDMGDILTGGVTINGSILNNSTLATNGQTEADTSATTVSIGLGTTLKDIYAINGNTTLPNPVRIGPGDTITYRLRYNLQVSDVENFFMQDFVPLPALSTAGISTTFDTTISATPPPANKAKFGPTDTFYALSNITPSIIVDTPSNSVQFGYGNLDDPLNRPSITDVLFTMTVTDTPFADGVNLVNQVRSNVGTTNSTGQVADAIVPVILSLPNLKTSKGIVSSDVAAATYTPVTKAPVTFNNPGGTSCTLANHRFTGTINSTNITATPITSDISGLDAGDLVTMVTSVENTGLGPNGAFKLQLKDILPAGLQVPTGGLNLCVTDGAGNPISYTPVNALDTNPWIQNGIKLTDTSGTQGSIKAFDPSNGNNIAIISYDLAVATSASPRQVLTNQSNLESYSASAAGPSFLSSPLTDNATVTLKAPTVTKIIQNTNQAITSGVNVAVGENVQYRVTVNVPEGTMPSSTIIDTLDAGLAFVSVDSITPSSGSVTTSNIGGFAGVASGAVFGNVGAVNTTNAGRLLTLNFGTLANNDTNNATAETITIDYTVTVINAGASVRGVNLNNSVLYSWNNGSAQSLATVSAPNVVVQEPTLQVVKTQNVSTGDANDIITYTITVSHTAASNLVANEVSLSDVIPASLTYQTGTLAFVSGNTPTTLIETSGTISGTWASFPLATTSVFSFQAKVNTTVVPSQIISNVGNLQWSSLPGTISATQSTRNTLAVERTGNVLDVGGATNNYRSSGTANFTVNPTNPVKSIVSTSESFTGNVATIERLAIGEVIRYRLAVRIPEGTAPALVLKDNLPAGMTFLNDGTSLYSTSSNGGLISDVIGLGSGCNQLGSSATITPTCTIPSGNITGGPFVDGTDPSFVLGNITNTDNDVNDECVVVEFNAMVTNVDGNQALNQAKSAITNTTLANTFQSFINTSTLVGTSAAVNIEIAEPLINNLAEAVTIVPTDAGDPIEYNITFSNTATGNNASPAFDLTLFDQLSSNFNLSTVTVTSKPGYTNVTDNSIIGSGLASLVFDKLNASDSITVKVTGVVVNAFDLGGNLQSSPSLRYTSLPGPGTTSNPTGSNSTLERNGTTAPAVNDYQALASFSIPTGTNIGIDKLPPAITTYTIGETPSFDILVKLQEGNIQNLRAQDILPVGLDILSYQVITTAAASTGVLSQDFGGTLSPETFSTVGQTATWNFGTTPVTADNNINNNVFLIRVLTRVRNVGTNFLGVNLVNNANLIYQNPSTLLDVNVPDPTPVTVTVKEPIVGIVKDISPAFAAPNDTVTITLTATNSGNSTAFETNLQDLVNTSTQFSNLTEVTTPIGWTYSTSPSAGNTLLTYTGGDIPSGQSKVFIFTATVQPTLAGGQTITNQASVSQYSSLSGSSAFERSYPVTTGSDTLDIRVPDLVLTKTDGQTTVVPGQALVYNVTVRNAGNYKADNVIITENLPTNTTFNATTSLPDVWTGTGLYTMNIGTLNPGQTRIVKFGVTVNSAIPSGATQITNNARADDDGTHGADLTPLNNAGIDVDTLNAAPDLRILKTDGAVTVTTADTITYTLNYNNQGNQDATGVIISETVPANTTFSGGTAGWSCSNGAVAGTICNFTIGNLAVGDSGSITFIVTTKNTIPAGVTQITNTVNITDDGLNGADPTPLNNQAIEPTPITATPDLTITKTDGQTTVLPGQPLTYTLTISNVGNQDATGVLVQDVLPNGMNYVSSANSGVPTGQTINWPTFNLGAGATVTRTVTVTVASSFPASVNFLINNATVSDDGTNGTDPTPLNNLTDDVDILDAAPDNRITKTDNGASPIPGNTLIYTLNYGNVGNQNSTGVVITETVPANTTFSTTGSTSGWSCTNGAIAGTTCTFTIGNLNVGASGSLTYAVLVDSPLPGGVDTINNTITINDDGTNGTDQNLSNNSDTEVSSANAAPDLFVTKTDNGVNIQPGELLTYDVNYSNTGNQNSTGVVITETVPANTTFSTTGSTSGWSCTNGAIAGTTCTFTIGNLNVGASGSLTYAVLVDSPLPGGVDTINNTITINDDGTNGTDQNLSDNTASETTPVIAAPEISITKTDGITNLDPGQTNLYTLTISNNGNQDATGVVITDTLPSTLTVGTISDSGIFTNPTITWPTITLAAGQSVTRTVNVTVNVPAQVPAGLETITNLATANDDGTNGADPIPSNNSTSDIDTLTGLPDLSIVKTDGLTFVGPAQFITYTLTVQNSGSQDASGVVITETVPTGSTFLPPSSTIGWSCANGGIAGSLCTYNLSTVSAGASIAIDFAIQTDATINQATLVNTATVADDGTGGTDPTPLNNTSTDTDNIIGDPNLAVVKDDLLTIANPGQTLPYSITVTNVGNVVSTGISVVDTIPVETNFVSASNSGTYNPTGRTVSWNISSLSPGQSQILTTNILVNTLIKKGVDDLTNVVTVSDDGVHGIDTNLTNNTASDIDYMQAAPDLEIIKTSNQTAAYPNQSFVYNLNYANIGNQEASGVVIHEVVPDNTTFLSADSSSGWSCSNGAVAGTTCNFTIGDLLATQNGLIKFAIKLNSTVAAGISELTNTVTLFDDGTNGNEPITANNQSTFTVPIPKVDLEIIKTVDKTSVKLQEELTYGFTYRNLGPDIATQVLMSDLLPSGFQFISAYQGSTPITVQLSDGGNGRTLIQYQLGDLQPGFEGTLQVKTKIINPTAGQIENQVTIQSREVDPEISNNRSSAFVTVVIPGQETTFNKLVVRTGGEIFPSIMVTIGSIALGILVLSFQRDNKKKRVA